MPFNFDDHTPSSTSGATGSSSSLLGKRKSPSPTAEQVRADQEIVSKQLNDNKKVFQQPEVLAVFGEATPWVEGVLGGLSGAAEGDGVGDLTRYVTEGEGA